jgi:hypothetical protein
MLLLQPLVAINNLDSAILTKYTSLRSFHEQTVRGTPLDYEIAGIYTSALLDSYMVSIEPIETPKILIAHTGIQSDVE